MSQIKNLEPKGIWNYFDQILQIPRPSKKEGKILKFIIEFARIFNLTYRQDDAGNILIIKNAYPGYEHSPVTILQSHVDMVCEKNEEIIHDFETDPIKAYIDTDWVKAKGTTLGADNGIGIAAQLALLADNTIEHGPIECLFTVDEETGLTGAYRLSPDFLSGKILINLDSEDDGELFIGCAGGMDTVINFSYKKTSLEGSFLGYQINIKGLIGGHSGDDIHKGRGNSNKLLTRFLINADQLFGIRLIHFQGGNLRNAIPREARAIIAIPQIDEEKFIVFSDRFKDIISNEFKVSEPNIQFSIKSEELPTTCMKLKYQQRFLNAMHACPNGVIEMSREMKNLVETSSNLASVNFINDNQIEIVTSQRSSVETAKKDIASRIASTFILAKGKVRHTDTYPGWTPHLDSEILKISIFNFEKLFGHPPIIRAIHAGLECGLFLKKYPKLDMISFGPTIRGAHSPDERLEISTVKKFWEFLLAILKDIH